MPSLAREAPAELAAMGPTSSTLTVVPRGPSSRGSCVTVRKRTWATERNRSSPVQPEWDSVWERSPSRRRRSGTLPTVRGLLRHRARTTRRLAGGWDSAPPTGRAGARPACPRRRTAQKTRALPLRHALLRTEKPHHPPARQKRHRKHDEATVSHARKRGKRRAAAAKRKPPQI